VRRRIEHAASGLVGLQAEYEQAAVHPTAGFMVVFEMMRRTPELLALREAIFEHVIQPLRQLPSSAPEASGLSEQKWPSCAPFVPHLSLVYDAHGQISATSRLEALTQRSEELREKFHGNTFAVDVIRIVDIDTNDYAGKWKILGEVRLQKGERRVIPASSLRTLSELSAEIPDLNRELFQRTVNDLGAAAALSSQQGDCAAAIVVLDGQIICSHTKTSGSSPHAALQLTTTDCFMAIVRSLPRPRLRHVVLFASEPKCDGCARGITTLGEVISKMAF
jgi:hypothetical protein